MQNQRDNFFYPLISTTKTVKLPLISMAAIGEKPLFNTTGGSPLCFPVIAFSTTRIRQGQSQQHICCESLTVEKSSFKCHIIKSCLSWFPFENSSWGRRGGEEESREEMLMAGFVLVLPRFLLSGSLSMVLSNYSSAVFNTRYDCSIPDGKRAWKSI